jgi:hypothetical protein
MTAQDVEAVPIPIKPRMIPKCKVCDREAKNVIQVTKRSPGRGVIYHFPLCGYHTRWRHKYV